MSVPADRDSLHAILHRHYVRLAVPPVSLLVLWFGLRKGGLVAPPAWPASEIMGPFALICAAVLGCALPIMLRAQFARKVAGRKSLSPDEFLRFEKSLINPAVSAVWFAALAYIFEVTLVHFAAAFLCALYGAYYHYPTVARVTAEMRLFRVRDGVVSDEEAEQ